MIGLDDRVFDSLVGFARPPSLREVRSALRQRGLTVVGAIVPEAFKEVYDGAANALQGLDLTSHVRQLLTVLEHHRELRRSFGEEPAPVRAQMNRWGVTRSRGELDVLAALEKVPSLTLRFVLRYGAMELGEVCSAELARRGEEE